MHMPKIYKNDVEYGGYFDGNASDIQFYPDRTGIKSKNVQTAIEEICKPGYGLESISKLSDSLCTGTISWQRINGMTVMSFIDLKLSEDLNPNDDVTIIPSGKISQPLVTTCGVLSCVANTIGIIDEGDKAIITNTYPGPIPLVVTIKSTGDVIVSNRSGFVVPKETNIAGQLMYIIKVL